MSIYRNVDGSIVGLLAEVQSGEVDTSLGDFKIFKNVANMLTLLKVSTRTLMP